MMSATARSSIINAYTFCRPRTRQKVVPSVVRKHNFASNLHIRKIEVRVMTFITLKITQGKVPKSKKSIINPTSLS